MQKIMKTKRSGLVAAGLIWIGLSLLLVGCQTLSERKQSDKLQQVLRNYEGVVRWGAVDQLRRFYRPEAMEAMVKVPQEQMRVTHYEVVQGPTKVEENRAIQTAVIQYVFVELQVVRELIDQQTWVYDPEQERWYLVSPAPDFK
jgi:hypothetical protein